MRHRGRLVEMLVIEQMSDGELCDVVVPAGSIIEWESEDDWNHDVTDEAINDCAVYLSENPNTKRINLN